MWGIAPAFSDVVSAPGAPPPNEEPAAAAVAAAPAGQVPEAELYDASVASGAACSAHAHAGLSLAPSAEGDANPATERDSEGACESAPAANVFHGAPAANSRPADKVATAPDTLAYVDEHTVPSVAATARSAELSVDGSAEGVVVSAGGAAAADASGGAAPPSPAAADAAVDPLLADAADWAPSNAEAAGMVSSVITLCPVGDEPRLRAELSRCRTQLHAAQLTLQRTYAAPDAVSMAMARPPSGPPSTTAACPPLPPARLLACRALRPACALQPPRHVVGGLVFSWVHGRRAAHLLAPIAPCRASLPLPHPAPFPIGCSLSSRSQDGRAGHGAHELRVGAATARRATAQTRRPP